MNDEADLDALIARIQSDLRSGRHPSRPALRGGEARRRQTLRALRDRAIGRAALRRHAAKWLAPAMIVAVVGAAVLLLGAR